MPCKASTNIVKNQLKRVNKPGLTGILENQLPGITITMKKR
jgi:hypothetical protein